MDLVFVIRRSGWNRSKHILAIYSSYEVAKQALFEYRNNKLYKGLEIITLKVYSEPKTPNNFKQKIGVK